MKVNKENSSTSAPAANLDHPFQGSEAAQPPQKDPQQLVQLQQQHQEQAQQPKEPFPQPSPPRQAKHAMVDYPEEEKEATAPPPKIPRLETTPLPLPPDWKSPISPVSGEADAGGPVAASDLPKVQLPLPAHPATVHQPPSLGPPPPMPYSFVTGMSSTSSFTSGEGYQNLQSMMKTNRSSYGALRPAYGRRAHLPHQPHVFSPNLPLPPVFPPPAPFLPPTIPPLIPRYPLLLPPNILNFPPPPPCRPPIHVAPPRHLRGLVLPPVSYLPAAIPLRVSALLPPVSPPGILSIRRLG